MKHLKLPLAILLTTAFGTISSGCGTTVGNPAVTLKNRAYTNGTVAMIAYPWAMAEPGAIGGTTESALAVTDFKFCNTKIKLENEGLLTEGGEVESRIGLVDASNPALETVWGQVNVPADAYFNEISVELHYDPEICGVGYSVSYQGTELTQDLEFNFRFAQPMLVAEGDTLSLGLTAIATAFEQASAAGKLNDAGITEYINETLEESGDKE